MSGSSWEAPLPGPFKVDIALPEADPMWAWADATGYADLGLTTQAAKKQGLWCSALRQVTLPSPSGGRPQTLRSGRAKRRRATGWS